MTNTEFVEKLNSNSAKLKGTTHQQYTEEQAMMAWETLDNSMIDKAKEKNQNSNETKFEDTKNDKFNIFRKGT